jgi:hypothetical protein
MAIHTLACDRGSLPDLEYPEVADGHYPIGAKLAQKLFKECMAIHI